MEDEDMYKTKYIIAAVYTCLLKCGPDFEALALCCCACNLQVKSASQQVTGLSVISNIYEPCRLDWNLVSLRLPNRLIRCMHYIP